MLFNTTVVVSCNLYGRTLLRIVDIVDIADNQIRHVDAHSISFEYFIEN